MIALTYEIELLEPCLVTSLQGDPNSGVAFPYLPGGVLRGAIIDRYLRQRRKGDKKYQLDAADERIQSLFFNGQTRYLNGYPLANSQRALPAPLSWYQIKGETEKMAYDFAVEDEAAADPEKDWRPFKPSFVWIEEDGYAPLEIERRIAVHIARDRHPNRSQDRQPRREVYRYDSLAAGQRFTAAILCPDEATATELLELAPEIVSLGGSRSGGYGRVKVSAAQSNANWRELPGDLTSNDETLTVTLLSDSLIRDNNGQIVVNAPAFTAALSARLNCPLTLDRAYYQAEVVGGFNRKWGLPLPQTTAFKMGSVFVFTVADCPLERLRELEKTGLGERRAEGFGRLAFNWQIEAKLSERDLEKPVLAPVTITADSQAAAVAQTITERLLRQRLDDLLAEKSQALGRSLRGVKRSQLHALRQVIHDALLRQTPEEGRQAALRYLEQAMKRRVSREQLEKGRVAQVKLIDWLQKRLNDTEEIWQSDHLGLADLPEIGGVKADMIPLAVEYNLRLVAAVLSRAAKVTE